MGKGGGEGGGLARRGRRPMPGVWPCHRSHEGVTSRQSCHKIAGGVTGRWAVSQSGALTQRTPFRQRNSICFRLSASLVLHGSVLRHHMVFWSIVCHILFRPHAAPARVTRWALLMLSLSPLFPPHCILSWRLSPDRGLSHPNSTANSPELWADVPAPMRRLNPHCLRHDTRSTFWSLANASALSLPSPRNLIRSHHSHECTDSGLLP